jgi:hypothetical protein
MIHVTEAAMRMLDRIDRPDGRVVRLVLRHQGRPALVLGKPRLDDVVLNREGHDSIHVQPAVNDLLGKAVLDTVDTPQGPTLSLKRS